MPLVKLPDVLHDIDFIRNSETGLIDLPKDATKEQREAFYSYKENIKRVQESRLKVIPLTPDEAKEALFAALEDKSKEDCKIMFERYKPALEEMLGMELDDSFIPPILM